MPQLQSGWPMLGHLVAFQRDPMAMLRRGFEALGEIFQFKLANRQFVVFAGPEAHEAFFHAPDTVLSAKEVYQFTIPIFGKGVAYDATSEVMAEQLAFLHPALRDTSMQRYARLMQEEIRDYFTGRWRDEGELDLPAVLNELTVNIASRCLLGEEIRSRLDSGFADLYDDLQGGINTLGFFLPRLPTPAHRKRDRARREVARVISGILDERRRTGHKAEDFMQALMDARYQDGRALSDEEISGLLLTVLFAGQHTSGVLATWTGLELLNDKQYLQRVIEEIETTYDGGRSITLANLKQQVVLDNAIREAMRLHPPLIILIRKVLEDFDYAGCAIPAGSMATVSPALSHRLPDVFKHPDQYDPDRFAPPREEHKVHPYTLVGFGGGHRRCIGTHFAYFQVKAIWTEILRHYQVEATSSVPVPNYGSWVTGPKPPCRIRYRRRS